LSVIKFTKAGWIYIILTILMGFSAINTNNNLVFITVSLMLAVMGVSGFYGKSNIEKLSFDISFENEIYARKKSNITVFVTNRKKKLISSLLNIEVLGEKGVIDFMSPKETKSFTISKSFENRGVVSIDKIVVSSKYPFNFFIRRKVYHINEEFIVFPEMIKTNISFSGKNKIDNADLSGIDEAKNQEEISNIRGYNNDPLNKIFWKHFAKDGNLYVKEFSSSDESYSYLSFDELLKKYDTEMAIKVATTIIYEMNAWRKPFIFELDGEKFNILRATEKLEALKRLALYGKN